MHAIDSLLVWNLSIIMIFVDSNRNSKSVELDTDEFTKAMQSIVGEASYKDAGSAARLEGHTSSSDMEFGTLNVFNRSISMLAFGTLIVTSIWGYAWLSKL